MVNCREFVNLILHEEKMVDGTVIPILSATIAELDGRGEIVFAEFVKRDDASSVPSDFSSATKKRLDAQETPPMAKTAE